MEGGQAGSLLPAALTVVLLSTLAGYIAFCVLLLRHSPEARKRRREQPQAAPVPTPPPPEAQALKGVADAGVAPAAEASSAPVTPETQSPARRPPSAASADASGLPVHQVLSAPTPARRGAAFEGAAFARKATAAPHLLRRGGEDSTLASTKYLHLSGDRRSQYAYGLHAFS